ncbi:MAG: NUDIX domain-containing protein [bacterium]|nr:NUDIX domain-containing protein [bacterium]
MTDTPLLIPRVGIGIIVLRDRRLLLGKRLSSHGSGTYQIPGGHLEFGETPGEAVHRETKEELNLTLKAYTFFGHYEFARTAFDVYLLPVADDFESTITVREGEYGTFFTPEDIAKEPLISKESRLILADVFEHLTDRR